MNRDWTTRLSCVVCGIETKRHTGWFLVVENRWLDRLRILSWHPVVARQPRMQSVCSDEHLKILLRHWLTYANLQFLATMPSPRAVGNGAGQVDSESFVGKVVGELAVHREPLSRAWTGSPQALECIIDALVGGMETHPRTSAVPSLNRATDYSREYALH